MPLPNLIIAGERRSGTTSIAHWMRSHPQIYLDPSDDLAFFSDSRLVGQREWFDGEVDLDQWPKEHSKAEYSKRFEPGAGKPVIGEKSADYLYWHPAHARMAEFVPSAKILFVLRNPIRRAWSMYWNEVAKGREKLSFEEAIDGEEARCVKSAYARYHLSYVRRGYSARSLNRFFEYFPREQVLVLILERCLKDPKAALQQVYRFLGVDAEAGLEHAGERLNENFALLPRPFVRGGGPRRLADLYLDLTGAISNRTGGDKHRRRRMQRALASPFWLPASSMVMSEATEAKLRAHYEPHVRELEELLGSPISEWGI